MADRRRRAGELEREEGGLRSEDKGRAKHWSSRGRGGSEEGDLRDEMTLDDGKKHGEKQEKDRLRQEKRRSKHGGSESGEEEKDEVGGGREHRHEKGRHRPKRGDKGSESEEEDEVREGGRRHRKSGSSEKRDKRGSDKGGTESEEESEEESEDEKRQRRRKGKDRKGRDSSESEEESEDEKRQKRRKGKGGKGRDSSESEEESEDEKRRKKRKGKDGKGRDSSESEEDEERRERRKKRREEKRKRREKRRREKDEARKQRKLLKEAQKFLKHHGKVETIESSNFSKPEGVEDISDADYFIKNPEFSTWLREDRRTFFSALSAEESRDHFAQFADAWNKGRLPPKYYSGINARAVPRTSHNWGFKGSLAPGQQDVDPADAEDERMAQKARGKLERKKARKEHEELMEELVPRPTGRDALVEKRKVRRDEARAREDSPEMVRERDVLGGGDDFQARLAREKAWREKKAGQRMSVVQEKQSAYEQKEGAKMDQLRALVAMAGGKITIAKRD